MPPAEFQTWEPDDLHTRKFDVRQNQYKITYTSGSLACAGKIVQVENIFAGSKALKTVMTALMVKHLFPDYEIPEELSRFNLVKQAVYGDDVNWDNKVNEYQVVYLRGTWNEGDEESMKPGKELPENFCQLINHDKFLEIIENSKKAVRKGFIFVNFDMFFCCNRLNKIKLFYSLSKQINTRK